MQGYFNYSAVPGNAHRLCSFRYEVCRTWRRMLQRRSQRHNPSWERFGKLEKRYIPPFRMPFAFEFCPCYRMSMLLHELRKAFGKQGDEFGEGYAEFSRKAQACTWMDCAPHLRRLIFLVE